MTRKATATEHDKFIGQKVMMTRIEQGKSREQLALKIGVTHQQLRKYEIGENRISASMLFKIAAIQKLDIRKYFKHEYVKNIGTYQTASIVASRLMSKIKCDDRKSAILHLLRLLAED